MEVALGEPAHTLMDLAERFGCSAIIAGARGKGGWGGDDLGSVSHELMHVSRLPVTIVKHAEASEEAEASVGEQEAPQAADEQRQACGRSRGLRGGAGTPAGRAYRAPGYAGPGLGVRFVMPDLIRHPWQR